MSKFIQVHKIFLLIIFFYFIIFGIEISYPIGEFFPSSFSTILICNLANGGIFSVRDIGLNTKENGQSIFLVTHKLLKIVDINGKEKIYASKIFYLLKKLPEKELNNQDINKIVFEKTKKKIRNAFLCYLYFFDKFSPYEDWWWIIRTEDNYIYMINYRNGELYEIKEILY
ncbi:MAG: hypothetical protein QMD25_07070 [Caldisericia bacterium]|jgi:hypothetical protein|nr:hypothetical protein [Caldisericia bacterium]